MELQRTKLSTTQIAKQWGVSSGQVLYWIHTGQLKAIDITKKLGGRPRYRVDVKELAVFETSRATQPAPKIPRRRKWRYDEGVTQYY